MVKLCLAIKWINIRWSILFILSLEKIFCVSSIKPIYIQNTIMPFKEKVDVKETNVYEHNPKILEILLCDRTKSRKNKIQNIIWATDNYFSTNWYSFFDEMTIDMIIWLNWNVIRPRTKKSKAEQQKRIKEKAEVFTPAWMCNFQNNLLDYSRFWYSWVFNVEQWESWCVVKDKIDFPKWKTWKDYVKEKRLEISCWEAPYLVSRYDATTWEILNVNDRIWLLDRKYRVLNENVKTEKIRFERAKEAHKSIYWYEWQWDSLLIARENILYTFIDNYKYKFRKEPSIEKIIEIAEIISRNIWQMDWIRWVIPCSCINKIEMDNSLFWDGKVKKDCCPWCIKWTYNHNWIKCKIKNRDTDKVFYFSSLFPQKN